MKSTKLSVPRVELIAALDAMSRHRRRRFISVLPVWLLFVAETGELVLQEDKGLVHARLPAQGDWPAAGATVDLYMLRGAARNVADGEIELHVVAEGVLVPTDRGYVRLNLLAFGPTDIRSRPPEAGGAERRLGVDDLPLFRWAATRHAV
ncbi:hypothetical protein BAL199_22722 [alpha proteobacterium BAL199]|nr:hypothetical protein BAL199_22722 [alpha proteobacterium BAL199]